MKTSKMSKYGKLTVLNIVDLISRKKKIPIFRVDLISCIDYFPIFHVDLISRKFPMHEIKSTRNLIPAKFNPLKVVKISKRSILELPRLTAFWPFRVVVVFFTAAKISQNVAILTICLSWQKKKAPKNVSKLPKSEWAGAEG